MDTVTKIIAGFKEPISDDFVLDLACKNICDTFQASSVSILMYDGIHDSLKCRGRFIKFEDGDFSIENSLLDKEAIGNYHIYNLINEYKEKFANEDEFLYEMEVFSKYYFFDLIEIRDKYRNFNHVEHSYHSIKNVLRKEEYKLDLESISGDIYLTALLTKSEIEYVDLDQVEKSKKLCEVILEEDLGVYLNKFNNYIGIPLYSENRLYGLLRVILSKDKYRDLQSLGKEKTLINIGKILSLNIEKKYYTNAYRDLISPLPRLDVKLLSLEDFLTYQINLFTKVINCKGGIILSFSNKTNEFVISSSSQSLQNSHILEKSKTIKWYKIIKNVFQGKNNLNGISINIDDLNVVRNDFYSEHFHITNSRTFRLTDYLVDDVFKELVSFDNHLLLISVPFRRNNFIILFNNLNRRFLKKDVEIILSGAFRFGYDLDKIQNQANTDIIYDLQKRVDSFLGILEEKTNGVLGLVDEFVSILKRHLARISLFHGFFIWEFINESLPSESDELIFLRLIGSGSKDENHTFCTSFNNIESETHKYLEEIGVFIDKSSTKTIYIKNSSRSQNDLFGMVTFLIRGSFQNREISDSENKFLIFLERQLNSIWTKVLDKLANKLLFEIDSVIYNEKTSLNEVSKFIAKNFKCNLCLFYMQAKNDVEKPILQIVGSNIANLESSYEFDKTYESTLTVQSYITNKDLRLVGYRRVRKYANNETLEHIERQYREYREQSNLVDQWQSIVISVAGTKLGLMKMFRFQSKNDSGVEYSKKPFSNFEYFLMKKIQKHIFNIILHNRNVLSERLLKEKQEKDRLEYMRVVSHQVISPLNALLQHCHNLQMGIYPNDMVEEKLFHLNILARQSVTYARSFQTLIELEKGIRKLEKATIKNLDSFLRVTTIDYQPQVKKKGISIFLNVNSIEEKLKIDLDSTLFNHAYFNLLDNASKYSFNRSQRTLRKFRPLSTKSSDIENVVVKVEEQNDSIIITVSNLGIPIPPSEREWIFEKDFRGEEALRNVPNGSGIGLYLTKKIINLHGGEIFYEPGQNRYHNVFKVILPL